MKYSIVLLLALLLVGCGGVDKEYTYNLTYTDGTEESVVTQSKMDFESGTDCIVSTGCGCGGTDEKFCGIRSFDLISEREINGTGVVTKSYKPDDDF